MTRHCTACHGASDLQELYRRGRIPNELEGSAMGSIRRMKQKYPNETGMV